MKPLPNYTFWDVGRKCYMCLSLDEASSWYGWLFYENHGNWVSLRKATPDDIKKLGFALPGVIEESPIIMDYCI